MAKESISASIRQEAEIAKVVLMPGDPLRAKKLADEFLEDVVCFNTVRNMLGFTGTYKGKRISVMGSGMGVPSMGIYATELFGQFDVDTIIRIGSAGGLAEDVNVKDVVIASGASTNSDYYKGYGMPGYFTPVASFEVLDKAVSAARELDIPFVVGPVYTNDHFYNAPGFYDDVRKFGVLAAEMETAGLYWTAASMNKKALTILQISDHLYKTEFLTAEERQNSFLDMMKIALETAWQMTE